MIMRTSFLIILVLCISACSAQPELAAVSADTSVAFPLEGKASDFDFSLSEEVFNLERSRVSYFLLLILFFPLVFF